MGDFMLLGLLKDVESPDRRTDEEKMADFFSNPVVWIVIGCVFVAIIASLHIAGYLKRRKETKFTVALNNEGSIEYIIVKRNERVMLPLMKREGYKFGGWFVDTAMITPFMPTEKITYNRMLYAKWVKEAD